METGECREDVGVDEVELSLNLVAPEVVNRCAILVQDQVLGVRPKPTTKQTAHSQCPLGAFPPEG